MNNTLLLEVLGILFSALITTGAISFFVRYGIRLALVEQTLKQNSIPAIAAKLVVLEHGFGEIKADVTDMKKTLKGLDQLDAMHLKVDMIADMVRGQGGRLATIEQTSRT